MSTAKSDTGQTETQETTAAVQRGSSPEAEREQSPQALWTHLSHELRTPLDAIIGSSELLLGDADGLNLPDFIANLNLIHSAGRQLLEIINDLLDTNKFASDDVVFNLASPLANLRISLSDHNNHEITDDPYGKVVAHLSASPPAFLVHFTSVPLEAQTFLAKFLGTVGRESQ